MSKKSLHIDDELLVDHVREFPCLYDHENKDFKDFHIRENTWKQIGEVLAKNTDECKSRWKHIRDNYLKHKRKLKLGTGSASSSRPTKWALFEHLTFLELVKSERSRIENCERRQNEDTQDSCNISDGEESYSDPQNLDQTECDPKSPEMTDFHQKKRKINSENKRISHTPRSQSSTPSTSSAKTKLLHNLDERSNQRMQMISKLADQKKEEDDIDLFMRSIALTVKELPRHLISQAKLQILTIVTNLQASADGSQTTTAPQITPTLSLDHSSKVPCLPAEPQLCTTSSDSSCIISATPDAYMSN